jgi:N-acetylglucosamine-6-phosphate deacetylase
MTRATLHHFTGQILLPEGFRTASIQFDTHIRQIQPLEGNPDAPNNLLMIPGFIDSHVHGGGGFDAMDGPEGVLGMARFHAWHGTTSILPTTMTAPWPAVLAALHGIREAMSHPLSEGAEILGAHLEGPFISPLRLGAQPNFIQHPTLERISEVLALKVIRAVTLAPELPGAQEAAKMFARAGVRVGLGHTAGSFEDAWQALEGVAQVGGRSSGTHLFNAMGGILGRDPGPLGALLTHPAPFLELIVDGFHLHPASVQLAVTAAPQRAMLISDAMRATGMPDGSYDLGGQKVGVAHKKATLSDGTLAGSVLTMDQGLRNLVALGIPLERAAGMCSSIPARSLGLTDRGQIQTGLRADLLVLDTHLNLQQVYLEGVPLYPDPPV